MNDVRPLIRRHWDMVDCLFDEVYLGLHDDTLHGPEMLDELFRYFAGHDPRFHAEGFRWNPRGYLEYRVEDTVYRAEGAIAAFLGLELKGNQQASYGALALVYRRFECAMMARVWLRWHVQKLHGFSNKAKELWEGYPREFPRVSHANQLVT